MLLKHLWLQHFRSYPHFHERFSDTATVILGPNTAGKTNLMESIWFLSTGKSFRAEKDIQLISFDREIARIKASISDNQTKETLEAVLAYGAAVGGRVIKRYLVNDIPKRRIDFAGKLLAVLFSPEELDIVSGSPSLRRAFLDAVLEQIDKDYRHASVVYEKALRQRNALLGMVRETGTRVKEQFIYWDELLVTNGSYITKRRTEFIDFINNEKKDIFAIAITYDHSKISKERLAQYADAEIAAGVTLVGPHRDDILISYHEKPLRYFGSRGQQRLAVLQLKLFQLFYIEKILGEKPLLLLDDIFSELDNRHMELVLSMIPNQQTILSTTHKEFLDLYPLSDVSVIELKK